jgi:hypothetical protein
MNASIPALLTTPEAMAFLRFEGRPKAFYAWVQRHGIKRYRRGHGGRVLLFRRIDLEEQLVPVAHADEDAMTAPPPHRSSLQRMA